MPSERGHRRRRFAFGMLEQAASMLGSIANNVLVVGLLVPTIAATSGSPAFNSRTLLDVVVLVLAFSGCTAAAAMLLQGMARQLEHGDPDAPEDR